ncbi:hypothetical protein CIG75_13700 [Tumebacillus algifaecis]|uniref:Uncharacterized protein n=1 Tax=Tumebacillus algifaecis TaxID=1214604 RepID=A0A223D2N5_9BACL|nr:hypothetical protein [Tumebacillus algifaecis]ASS75908.1 hypothetical protein CIG75_13700 [Tumebacillus algifaecis]
MSIRRQLEQEVFQRLEEAEGYFKRMRDERLDRNHPRFSEWSNGVELLFWLSFGELSPHYRTWQTVLRVEATEQVLYSRLSGCLHRARRALLRSGLPNPLLLVPAGFVLPSFPQNHGFVQKRKAERACWELFFAEHFFAWAKL